MANSLYQQIGGLRLPLTADDVDSELSLDTLDPAKRRLLAWLVAAVNAELGGAWTKVVAALPYGHELSGSSPISDSYPYEPTAAVLRERKTGWPVLFLHRAGDATFDEFTAGKDRCTQQWQAHYILCPMTVGHAAKVQAALQFVPAIIRATLANGLHPAYESGASQLDSDTSGLHNAELKAARAGTAQFSPDDPAYLATLMTIETQELIEFREGYATPYEGMDTSHHVSDGDSLHFDMIQTDTSTAFQDS